MKKEMQQLRISVYQGNGEIDSDGNYTKDNLRSVYFLIESCDDFINQQGDSRVIAKEIVSDLNDSKGLDKISAVRFEYPDDNRGVNIFIDGYKENLSGIIFLPFILFSKLLPLPTLKGGSNIILFIVPSSNGNLPVNFFTSL
jgi:hypothetical protein